MKIKLPLEKFYHLINHGPCCLITSGNDKIKNIAPIAWITPLNDDPPLVVVCIASSHYTAELINKYREFVINVPGIKLLDVIKQTGKTSGREIDKFNLVKLTPVDGVKVKVVHIDESIGFIESKVVDSREYDGVILFIGRVVHCEVEESFYDKYLLTDKAKTVHHVGGNKFFISTKAI